MCIYSVDDDTFMHLTNVVNEDFVSQDFPSHEYDTSYDDENLDMEDEGFVGTLKGIITNYLNTKDVLICMAWKRVSIGASIISDQSASTY